MFSRRSDTDAFGRARSEPAAPDAERVIDVGFDPDDSDELDFSDALPDVTVGSRWRLGGERVQLRGFVLASFADFYEGAAMRLRGGLLVTADDHGPGTLRLWSEQAEWDSETGDIPVLDANRAHEDELVDVLCSPLRRETTDADPAWRTVAAAALVLAGEELATRARHPEDPLLETPAGPFRLWSCTNLTEPALSAGELPDDARQVGQLICLVSARRMRLFKAKADFEDAVLLCDRSGDLLSVYRRSFGT